MATTSNYSWTTPDNTDYVKDGALAIRTLGSSVDTTLFTALGGAYPGMRLVKKQTVGTGVTSVNVTSAFSATYENYRIIWNGGTGSLDNELRIQMGATTTGYYYNNFGTSWTTTFVGGGSPGSGNRWEGAGTIITTTGAHLDVEINNPFASSRTIGKGSQVTTSSARTTMFMLNNTTSYTDFTISPQVGTLTGGTIYVYGYGIS
jgi:hypothetical protein